MLICAVIALRMKALLLGNWLRKSASSSSTLKATTAVFGVFRAMECPFDGMHGRPGCLAFFGAGILSLLFPFVHRAFWRVNKRPLALSARILLARFATGCRAAEGPEVHQTAFE